MVSEDVDLYHREKYAKIETPAMKGKKSATIIRDFDRVNFLSLCIIY